MQTAIALGKPKLRQKTLYAVVDHITQVVAGPSGTYVEPLVNPLVKALTDLLSQQEHVEHLSIHDQERWHACITFFINVIEKSMPTETETHAAQRGSPVPGTPAMRATSLRASSVLYTKRNADAVAHGPLDDAITALRSLIQASNAPVLSRFDDLTSIAIRFLGSSKGQSLSKIGGFAVLNGSISAARCAETSSLSTLLQSLLPLMAYWWRPEMGQRDLAQSLLRQEILITTLLTTSSIEHAICKANDTDMVEEVEQLLEAMWSEYSRRETKLELHDVTFSGNDLARNYFQNPFFGLRCFNINAEGSWVVLQSIAELEAVLHKSSENSRLHSGSVNDADTRRKRRLAQPVSSRILSRLRATEPEMRLATLHALPFTLGAGGLDAQCIAELVPMLLDLTNNKDSGIASWALVGLASCVYTFPDNVGNDVWKQAWLMATRTISISSTSRAACMLLRAITVLGIFQYHEISEDINGIVATADVRGPALLCDTSIAMMFTFFHSRNAKLPNASQATSNHIIRWLFQRWKPNEPSNLETFSPLDIATLLFTCTGTQPFLADRRSIVPGGPLYATHVSQLSTQSFENYLLLLDVQNPPVHHLAGSMETTEGTVIPIATASGSHSTKKLVLELLYPKMDELRSLCDSWSQERSDGNTHISIHSFGNLLMVALTGALILPQVVDVNSSQATSLESLIGDTLERAITSALSSSDRDSFTEELMQSLGIFLPKISAASIEKLQKQHYGLYRLFIRISSALNLAKAAQDSGPSLDSMDLDEEFQSQSSRATAITSKTALPRLMCDAQTSLKCFYYDIQSRLQLLDEFHQDESQVGLVPAIFVEDLTELSHDQLLLRFSFITELFTSDLVTSSDTALLITQRLGQVVSKYAFECCELSWTFCLDALNGLAPSWLQDEDFLATSVGDLYHHIIKTTLPASMLSPQAQISLCSLLFTLLKAKPEYGTQLELDSCRTSLLRILESAPISVKCYIAERIPEVFELFILVIHDDIFIDVLASLPADPSQLSGIAFRLSVLAKLACRWPTLLRRCVYHIFETPGRIESVSEHAKRCMKQISSNLNLQSPKELFSLFSRQLLYTWMEENSIATIPFAVFEFDALAELIEAAESEAVGLAYMRDQSETQKALAECLGNSDAKLLQDNFATALTFSLAHVASIGGGKDQGELRLTQKMSSKLYTESVYTSFVDIVTSFFLLIDQEDAIEKVLAKYPELNNAAENLATIMKISHSTAKLPPNQQPTFRAKYVIFELNRLCLGTQFQLHEIWTPALVVSIVRKLLNTIQPALGSLHACAVLRKIRLVVAMAGHVAFGSYCLEMLLDTIRVFVTDSECADDALGISQYLLLHGKPHLDSSPSFLAGYALSTLVSLRVFLESSQSSTTQESQFKATMSKAKAFHEWFTKYLESGTILFTTDKQRESFQAITKAAGHTRSSGNSERNTYESKLLLNILKDSSSREQLLNQSSRQLAMSLLCGSFSMPPQVMDDIISKDSDSTKYAPAVWKSCGAENLSENYLAWAGRVIGRSFVASGDLPAYMLRETHLQEYMKIAPNSNGSEMGILSLLQDLTSNPDTITAGLAEAALRLTVSRATAVGDAPLLLACEKSLRQPLYSSSMWGLYHSPPSESIERNSTAGYESVWTEDIGSAGWVNRLAVFLTKSVADSILLATLSPVLEKVEGFAYNALPFVIHLVLIFQHGEQQVIKRMLSDKIKDWMNEVTESRKGNIKVLINTILYLRTQEYPKESTITDRLSFLDLDYALLASVATQCGMYKSALLFIEIASWESSKTSRRASVARQTNQTDTLLAIFENIDDPDAYYGVPEEANLANVLARVEYENDGSKTLAFRGAQLDSDLRLQNDTTADGQSLVKALSSLGYSGLSHSLMQTQQETESSFNSIEGTYNNARRLEMWNLPAAGNNNHYAVTTYKAYQAVYLASETTMARNAVYDALSEVLNELKGSKFSNANILRKQLGALASLTELDELLNIPDASNLHTVAETLDLRSEWMKRGVYSDVHYILSCRETALSLLAQRANLVGNSTIPKATLRQLAVNSLLTSSKLYRFHRSSQESLNISTTLSAMIPVCEKLDLHVDAAVTIEIANSLWDHGEEGSSIRMLQAVDKNSSLNKQAIPVKRADLLAKIGDKASEARLEKPRDIQKKYLEPALKDLDGESNTREAGLVFHQFAKFCDEQLQDADGLEDLGRLQSLKQAKSEEVAQLKQLISATKESQLRTRYNHALSKEKQWLDLDNQELRRVEQTRAEFVRLSLENYLLALAASDDHDNDALRFTALWLQRPEDDVTNKAVARYLARVPTRKFAALMNQMTSRLQNDESIFQKLLMELVYSVCVDHPYHGMYQVWSGTKAKIQQNDEVALKRVKATDKIAERLMSKDGIGRIWTSIDKTSKYYHQLAMDRDKKYKAGDKIPLKSVQTGSNLASCLARYHIPPPTMSMEVNATCDYSNVPTVAKLDPTMSIASGVSAPKIITLIGTDGRRYKQLVKGGHDDLRQDAIMEQVFAAVSSLLKFHRATQQRNLGIRTYKVLPLTASSGLIEFVPNTMPLHDFLMPAHERYYPRDAKGSACRKEIYSVQGQSVEIRVSTYKKITERFHPVMKHFFMEYFIDPDEWFSKRLAYTRSTAAISMLGHVLGLGDRHGHNILLDTRTGEAVHIDLGVAFEAGRILPVPELVPFRLTRDIVDGMGVTKTEGVFRRCCEFTLDALREEQYSIMTILDVLRYDPLYSWTIAPVRMARLQKNGHEDESVSEEALTDVAKKDKKKVNEPSEADRSLEIVRKKLSKALSVSATVNDLINQATDERNLAVLYCGKLLLAIYA